MAVMRGHNCPRVALKTSELRRACMPRGSAAPTDCSTLRHEADVSRLEVDGRVAGTRPLYGVCEHAVAAAPAQAA